MRRIPVGFFLGAFFCLSLVAGPATAVRVPPESRTLFHHAENAWGVGTISLGKPLTFREGKILVFPSEFTDLLWAPDGTKPRSLMLIHEVFADDKEPFFAQGEKIFAPIQLLPDHAYWKDNLPNTRRHGVHGGRRYVFRGAQIPEVRELLAAYLTSHDTKGMERWSGMVAAVAKALGSTIPVVREDAVRYFVVYPTLARDIDEKSLPLMAGFLSGDAPAAEKAALIDALAAGKVTSIMPTLAQLAARDDATGAAALAGLERFGEPATTERLLALAQSASVEMQAYAVEALGARAGTDSAALARVTEILAAPEPNSKLAAAASQGLARSKGDEVVAALAAAVAQGNSASRPAAQALAAIGGPAAEAALTTILKEKTGEAALAATVGLGTMPGCRGCSALLRDQHDAHADPAVRSLAGVVLGVPDEHKH
ncbi:MAG: HEAT repeat domain-containing protein [Candidatus Binatia bacterium]